MKTSKFLDMEDIQIKILNCEEDINFGYIYENVAAQELKAHGFELKNLLNKRKVCYTIKNACDLEVTRWK